MADTTALKNRIRAAVKANDNQEITGPVLQQALLDMVDELNGATETEASQRQNGDSTLQQSITAEKNRAEGVEQSLSQDATNVQQAVDEVQQAVDEVQQAVDEVQQAVDEVHKKSNYNDGDNIIDFNTIHIIENNPEYICVAVDANNKILYGIKTDGQPYFGVGCPQQVKDYIDKQINKILGTDDITSTIDSLKEIEAFLKDFTNSDTLKKLLDLKANVDEVRATTDDIYKKSNPNDSEGNVVDTNTIISVEDNPEYIKVLTDSVGKLIEAIGIDGIRRFFAGINIQGTLQCITDNPEFISVELDKLGHILGGWKTDGDYYFGTGVPTQIQLNTRDIYDELSTANAIEIDADNEGNVYATTGINGNLSVEFNDNGNVFLIYDTDKVDIEDAYEEKDGTLIVEQNKVITL